MSTLLSRTILFLLYCAFCVFAKGSSSTSSVILIGETGSKSGETDSANLLQRYWDLRDTLAAKPNRAPLVVDNTGSMKVNVKASFGVVNIIKVDDVIQTVLMTAYLQLWWQDRSLAWNVSDYNGVDSMELTSEELWTPDVLIVNSLTEFYATESMDTYRVNHEGLVHARLAINTETLCAMDLSRFPYDEQKCPVSVGSYSKLINWTIIPDEPYKDALVASLFQSAFVLESSYPQLLLSPQYDELLPTVWLKLRRKTRFYTVCLVLPMVLTSYMNTLVFLLPLESGEKVSYHVTLFVSTSVYISFFGVEMPRGLDTVPSIMCMQLVVVVESLLFLLATIFVLRRHHQKEEEEKKTDPASGLAAKNQPQQVSHHSDHLYPPRTASGPQHNVFITDTTASERRVTTTRELNARLEDVKLCGGHVSAGGKRLTNGSLVGKQSRWRDVTAFRLDCCFFVFAVMINTVVLSVIWLRS